MSHRATPNKLYQCPIFGWTGRFQTNSFQVDRHRNASCHATRQLPMYELMRWWGWCSCSMRWLWRRKIVSGALSCFDSVITGVQSGLDKCNGDCPINLTFFYIDCAQVLSWVLMTAALSIQKTWITLYVVKHGSQRNLRTLGIASQIGSAVGALISFLLTAKFNVFVPKVPCV